MLAGALVILSGCSPSVWVKPGATAADEKLQEYECDMQAKTANQGGDLAVGLDRALDSRRCMSAHGYVDTAVPR